MLENLPNLHPIFVNFTVGLFTTSFVFYCLALFTSHYPYTREFEITARWCLLSAALISSVTFITGLQAFNIVHHDDAAHLAMEIHRRWAVITLVGILLLALWEWFNHLYKKPLHITVVSAMLIVQIALTTTAWYGAGLVFVHGLGVLSLPSNEDVLNHHHDETSLVSGLSLSMRTK